MMTVLVAVAPGQVPPAWSPLTPPSPRHGQGRSVQALFQTIDAHLITVHCDPN